MQFSFEELDRLTDQFTDPEIMEQYNLTRKVIQNLRAKLGVKCHAEKVLLAKHDQYTFEVVDRMTDFYSDAECAMQIGWPRGTFVKHRLRLGVKSFYEKTGLIKLNGEALTKQERALRQQEAASAAAIKATTGATRPNCRKHFFDEDFFEEINTEEKAYFLGLIIADGCIENRCSIAISLKESDSQILEDFYMAVGKIAPLSHQPRKDDKCFQEYNSEDRKRARLNSVKMVRDLQALGVSQAKTFTSTYPNIPRELDRHCIRGIVDGDGSVSTNGFISISVCKPLLDTISPILEYHGFPFTSRPSKSIFALTVPKSSGFHRWLYKDASVYLERKYQRAKLNW